VNRRIAYCLANHPRAGEKRRRDRLTRVGGDVNGIDDQDFTEKAGDARNVSPNLRAVGTLRPGEGKGNQIAASVLHRPKLLARKKVPDPETNFVWLEAYP